MSVKIMYYVALFVAMVLQAICSTAFSVFFAMLFAHGLLHSTKIIQNIIQIISLFCMVMPTTTCAISVLQLFQWKGLLPIIITHSIMNIPFLAYVIYNSYTIIDMQMILVARSLGASQVRVYIDILFPVIKPLLYSMSAITFIYCISSFSPPLILGTSPFNYTIDIFLYKAYETSNWNQGVYFFSMRLISVFVAVMISSYNKNIPFFDSDFISYAKQIRPRWDISFITITGVFFLLYPFIWLVMSITTIEIYHFYTFYHMQDIIYNTVCIACISSIGSLLIGSIGVVVLHVYKKISIRFVIQLCALFPFFISSVGISIICIYVASMLKSYTHFMIAVTHMFLHYPFIFQKMYTHWQLYPKEFLLQAYSLGAHKKKLFFTVIIPYMKNIFVRSGTFVFALSLVESGGASLVVTKKPFTLALGLKCCIKKGDIVGVVGLSLVLFFLISCVVITKFFCKKLNYKK